MIRKIRHKSRKRARTDRAAKQALAEFAAEFPFCWCCRNPELPWEKGGEYVWMQTHHICGKDGAWRDDRRTWFRCCSHCHESRWTNPTDGLSPLDRLAQQLAYKAVFDPGFYDRGFVLACKGLADTALSEGDVGILVKLIREASDG